LKKKTSFVFWEIGLQRCAAAGKRRTLTPAKVQKIVALFGPDGAPALAGLFFFFTSGNYSAD
jgi:hypothetical protein